ncbi:hypothetical protein Tco_0105637, partial [Tanacetum coccineum]
MTGSDDENTPPPPPTQQAPHTVSTIKLPILKKGEYDIWAMKMKHYLSHTDYPIWEVIQKGNCHSLPSQLEIHGAGVSTEDANQKFLRSLPSSWSQVSLVMRTKPGVDSLNFDDLYNNLRVFESNVKGSTGSSSSAQNVTFVSSESTSSTNDVSTAYGVSTSSGYNSQWENSSSYTDELMYSLFANQSSGPQLDHEDLIENVETLESMPKLVVVEPKVVSQPKVWSDAPIIEEYKSDSDDEYVIQPSKEHERPSFAFVNTVKHVKTPRKTVKEQNTYSPSPKANKRNWNGLMSKRLGLGYGFTKKACFVCGSFNHLIRDCDFHEKRMAKQVELNKKKGKGTGQGENRLVWNNVQRSNHQNKFVPKAVLTKTGIFPVNTTRQNLSSQAATTSTAWKVNTARPIVNEIRPRSNFYKSHSPIRRLFNRTTSPKANVSNQKVNTAEVKAVSAVGDIRETDNPQRALKNKGIVDSGCSRHMNDNKAYLVEYQDYNGGPVAFGSSKGYITGKVVEMDIREKDEKLSKTDKTKHGMEKRGKAKVKSKPKSKKDK